MPSSSAGWAEAVPGRQNGDVVLLDGDQRFFERRPADEHIGEPGPLGQPEQPVLLRRAEVGVDHADALLIFLRHRQPEVGDGQALAVAAAGTRHEDDVDGGAAFVVQNPRAERAILLGGDAGRRDGGDQPMAEPCAADHADGRRRRRPRRPSLR